MLTIVIPEREFFNEETCTFHQIKSVELQLEHSLISLSKWESKWHKPFLDKNEKTPDEMIDYIRCMTLNKNVDPNVYFLLTPSEIEKINEYIESPMTATWFSDDKKKRGRSREIVTAEIIYYWMIALNIPITECQKWHLNRLLTLVRVCSIKNTPPKKMKKQDIIKQNKSLNAYRRQGLNSRG